VTFETEVNSMAAESARDLVRLVGRALLAQQRHHWEHGTAAQAFLESGEADLVVLMARDAVQRQIADGRLAMIGDMYNSNDAAASGEAVLFAARRTGDPALAEGAKRMLNWLLVDAPRAADGTVYHLTNRQQIWVDGIYMAPPFLAVAGYPEQALAQIAGYRKALWDPEARLYHHIWDDAEGRFKNPAFWGVGNGWAAAGLIRVAAALPESMAAERKRVVGYAREVVDGCLARQRPDGLFHNVLDDPTTFVETNVAQQIAYAIYRSVALGWLDAGYLSAADRMRAAARAKVDEYGLVQGVCASPRFDRPGYAPEGQAFFLLMEAAAKLAGR
jgi:rhamnogalacturonyl hydrolase YesR